MNIDYLCDCGFPQELVADISRRKNITELWPIQRKAIKCGVFSGKSVIVSAPTASGKTLIGELVAIKNALDGRKTLYLVPLKALAEEKYSIFEEDYNNWFTSSIFTRDRSSPDRIVRDSSLVIGTYEKVDLLIRNRAGWLKEIRTVIVDEIQMINDPDRGPVLELIITRLKNENRDLQIIGLSATLHEDSVNSLSEWLEAEPILDNWRPVELVEGKYSLDKGQLIFKDGTVIDWIPESINNLINSLGKENALKYLKSQGYDRVKEYIARELTKKYLEDNKQVLVFASDRKQAERFVSNLGLPSKTELQELASNVLQIVPEHSKTVRNLERCVRCETAFHHAGLRAQHRKFIEEKFSEGVLRVICATTTLSMGVNFPADIVIFLDHKLKFSRRSLDIISYQNMSGRAGRPMFSKDLNYKGYSILIAIDKSEELGQIDQYLKCTPQKIDSKLAALPALRKCLLTLIATLDDIRNFDDVLSFISKTFFGYIYSDLKAIENRLKNIINHVLIPLRLISSDEKCFLNPTELGRSVAKVGLDPFSLRNFDEGLKRLKEKKELSTLAVLQLTTRTFDFQKFSYLYTTEPQRKEYLEEFVAEKDALLFTDLDLPIGRDTEEWKSIRGLFILNDWVNEISEGDITDKHDIYPGDLERIVELANWILESLISILEDLGLESSIIDKFKLVAIRLKYGIKEDLVELFQMDIETIGRRQARNLYNNGFTNYRKILDAGIDQVAKAGIQRTTAVRLLKELIKKLEISKLEKMKISQILRADELRQNPSLIKNLYESTGELFSHYVNVAFNDLMGDNMSVGRFPQNGNPDVWIKEDDRYFATIECYAPKDKKSISLSKILEARKGEIYFPTHICVCTNAENIPSENIETIRANDITVFHVSGLAELLIQRWDRKIDSNFVRNVFSIKGDPIDNRLVREKIRNLS